MSSRISHPIEVDHIWKSYRLDAGYDSLRDAIPGLMKRLFSRNGAAAHRNEFLALQDVSFHVAKGETLGIIGPNGAGKSTILKLLSRIAKQTKGTIAIRGRLAALIELGGGFHQDLSGGENIYLQGTMLGLSRREIKTLFDSIVAFADIGKFIETPVKRYSSGMVVRLGFAIAAHVHPDILLLDEVLSVGDLAFQQKSFQRILELRNNGTTMIFISHDLDSVRRVSDRVIGLHKGQIVDDGEPEEVIRRYRQKVNAGTVRSTSGQLASDGPVVITDVQLRNPQGIEEETFIMSEPLRIDISFRAKQPIIKPDIAVWIERADQLICHDMRARQEGFAPAALRGEGVITLQYPSFNLLPGSYCVSVAIYEEGLAVPVGLAHRCRTFQVSAEIAEQGIVHLDHAWGLIGQE